VKCQSLLLRYETKLSALSHLHLHQLPSLTAAAEDSALDRNSFTQCSAVVLWDDNMCAKRHVVHQRFAEYDTRLFLAVSLLCARIFFTEFTEAVNEKTLKA